MNDAQTVFDWLKVHPFTTAFIIFGGGIVAMVLRGLFGVVIDQLFADVVPLRQLVALRLPPREDPCYEIGLRCAEDVGEVGMTVSSAPRSL